MSDPSGVTTPRDLDEIVAGLGDAAAAFEGATVLLTGSGGFLGRWMVRALDRLNATRLAKPLTLIALDSAAAGEEVRGGLERPAQVRFVHHDLAAPVAVDGPIRFAIHMAGIASPQYYRAKPLETLDVSFNGTRQILDLAKRDGARFMFFSSSEIYGDPDPKAVPTPETYRGYVATMGPRSCYDEGKRVGETLCYIYATHLNVHACAVRPFNVYGPGMKEKDYRVLPNFGSALKGGRRLRVYGDGRQTRTYCYVTDAMAGFLLALLKSRPGEAYNIGNPEPEISVLDLVKRIEAAVGRPVPHDLVGYPDAYPPDEPNRRCPDIAKARAELGYRPRVAIDDGLKRFFAWTERTYTGAA